MHRDGPAYDRSPPPTPAGAGWAAPLDAGGPSVPTPRLSDGGSSWPGPPPQWSTTGSPPWSAGQVPYQGTYPGTVPSPPSYPPPPAPSRGGSGSSRGILVGVLVAVLLLAVGGGTYWFLSGRAGGPIDQAGAQEQPRDGGPVQKGDPTMQPPPTAGGDPSEPHGDPRPSTGPTPSDDPVPTDPESGATGEEVALATLQTVRNVDLARVVLDGRWVAQVASKHVGITDPLQTAPNGSHTFYAVDILAEYTAVLETVQDPNVVYLLTGTDFGRTSTGPGGLPFWITVVDGGFADEAAVDAWCAQTYGHLPPEQLENACTGRTLTPPHD